MGNATLPVDSTSGSCPLNFELHKVKRLVTLNEQDILQTFNGRIHLSGKV